MFEIETGSPEYLHESVRSLRDKKYRLVQIHCTQCKVGENDGNELTYTFDKNLEMRQLRVLIPQEYVADSISNLYNYAFIYENEIKDLFGVKFRNLSIDFGGHFYKTSISTPMKKDTGEGKVNGK